MSAKLGRTTRTRVFEGVAAAALFAVGCAGEQGGREPPRTPAPLEAPSTAPTTSSAQTPLSASATPKTTGLEEVKETMKGVLEAFNAHDTQKLMESYAESALFREPGLPDYNGKVAIQKMLGRWITAFPDAKMGFSRVFVKGDVVIVEWAWSGKNTGEIMGMKATDKEAGAQGAQVVWLTPEGKIREEHSYSDRATKIAQLGLAPKGAPKPRAVPAISSTIEWHVSRESSDDDKILEPARKAVTAFGHGSTGEAELLSVLTDATEWDDVTMPAPRKGMSDAKKFYRAITTAFPDVRGSVERAWAVDDFAIVEWTMTGTHEGSFMGVPPTKKPVTIHGVNVGQLKDGTFTRATTYWNTAEMMTQLGLMKVPGPVQKQ